MEIYKFTVSMAGKNLYGLLPPTVLLAQISRLTSTVHTLVLIFSLIQNINDTLAENRFNYERVNGTDQVDPTELSTEWPVRAR